MISQPLPDWGQKQPVPVARNNRSPDDPLQIRNLLGHSGLGNVERFRHPRNQFQVGQGSNYAQVAERYSFLEIIV